MHCKRGGDVKKLQKKYVSLVFHLFYFSSLWNTHTNSHRHWQSLSVVANWHLRIAKPKTNEMPRDLLFSLSLSLLSLSPPFSGTSATRGKFLLRIRARFSSCVIFWLAYVALRKVNVMRGEMPSESFEGDKKQCGIYGIRANSQLSVVA